MKKVRTKAPSGQQSNKTHNQQSRAGLRPRTAPGKAKTTFARAKAPVASKKTAAAPSKSINQKLAIKRLNKARETLQKAVKAVNDANKNLAKQMPTQQKKSYVNFCHCLVSFYLQLVCRLNNQNKMRTPSRNKRRNRRSNANRTMARCKSGTMCAVAMSPSKSAIADHLGMFILSRISYELKSLSDYKNQGKISKLFISVAARAVSTSSVTR